MKEELSKHVEKNIPGSGTTEYKGCSVIGGTTSPVWLEGPEGGDSARR